jgi:hypothetical protein
LTTTSSLFRTSTKSSSHNEPISPNSTTSAVGENVTPPRISQPMQLKGFGQVEQRDAVAGLHNTKTFSASSTFQMKSLKSDWIESLE